MKVDCLCIGPNLNHLVGTKTIQNSSRTPGTLLKRRIRLWAAIQHHKNKEMGRLQEHLPGILRVTLVRAVRALEAEALAESVEGFRGNNMSARHHHRRVLVRGLLLGDRADKDRMKEE